MLAFLTSVDGIILSSVDRSDAVEHRAGVGAHDVARVLGAAPAAVSTKAGVSSPAFVCACVYCMLDGVRAHWWWWWCVRKH
jgi:hypothetical protein